MDNKRSRLLHHFQMSCTHCMCCRTYPPILKKNFFFTVMGETIESQPSNKLILYTCLSCSEVFYRNRGCEKAFYFKVLVILHVFFCNANSNSIFTNTKQNSQQKTISLSCLRSSIFNDCSASIDDGHHRYWGFDSRKTSGLVFFLSFCRRTSRLAQFFSPQNLSHIPRV